MSSPRTPTIAAIALGSNQPSPAGPPRDTILAAIIALRELPDTTLLNASSLYETKPVSDIPQPNYINAAASIETSLTPHELLRELLKIERCFGRARTSQRNTPRTLDLDILFYGDVVLSQPELTLPHPRLHERRFALEPLAEALPDYPIAGPDTRDRTARQMMHALNH